MKIRELWYAGTHPKFFANLYSIVSGQVLESWRKMSILSCKKTEDRIFGLPPLQNPALN